MDSTEAQRYDAALEVYSFAQGEVYTADREKQGIERDLRCGVIQTDNPAIAAIDKVFCAARLAMAQARDDLADAERQMAAALAPQRTPLLEVKLALVAAHAPALHERYQREVVAVTEATDHESHLKRRYILANTKSMILRYEVPEGVST